MIKIFKQQKKSRRWVLASGMAALAGPALGATAFSHYDIARLAASAFEGDDRHLKILLPVGSRANVEPIAQAFTRLSGIEILMTEVAVDEVDVQLSLDSLSGTSSYDLALPPTFAIPDLVEGGVIASLNDIDGFEDAITSQKNSLFTVGDTFDGAHYGFQTDGDAYLMFYNNDFPNADGERDRFADRFGVALETPKTWQDLDRQLEWFHRPDEGKIGGLLFRSPTYAVWEWWIRFHATGTWPFSADLTPQIATDAGVGALEDMMRATQFLAPKHQQSDWLKIGQDTPVVIYTPTAVGVDRKNTSINKGPACVEN